MSDGPTLRTQSRRINLKFTLVAGGELTWTMMCDAIRRDCSTWISIAALNRWPRLVSVGRRSVSFDTYIMWDCGRKGLCSARTK